MSDPLRRVLEDIVEYNASAGTSGNSFGETSAETFGKYQSLLSTFEYLVKNESSIKHTRYYRNPDEFSPLYYIFNNSMIDCMKILHSYGILDRTIKDIGYIYPLVWIIDAENIDFSIKRQSIDLYLKWFPDTTISKGLFVTSATMGNSSCDDILFLLDRLYKNRMELDQFTFLCIIITNNSMLSKNDRERLFDIVQVDTRFGDDFNKRWISNTIMESVSELSQILSRKGVCAYSILYNYEWRNGFKNVIDFIDLHHLDLNKVFTVEVPAHHGMYIMKKVTLAQKFLRLYSGNPLLKQGVLRGVKSDTFGPENLREIIFQQMYIHNLDTSIHPFRPPEF